MTAPKRRRIYPSPEAFFKETGLTQQWVARQVGISQPYLSNILRGRRTGPAKLLFKLSRVMGVPVEWFVADRNELGQRA